MRIKPLVQWLAPSVILALAIIIGGLAVFNSSLSQEATPATPQNYKIGVVNIMEVFSKYEKSKVSEVQLEKSKKEEEKKIKAIEKEIENLMETIKGLKYGESAYKRQLREKLATLSARHDYLIKSWDPWIKQQINKHTVERYNEIRETIDIYAVKNGFTFILKTDRSRLGVSYGENAADAINTRAVLYHQKVIDITDEIVKALNK